MITITSGMLSMAILEALKWIVGKINKIPDYNFPPFVFKIGIPCLNVVMPFILVALGFPPDETEVLTMTWMEVARYVLRVLVASIFTLMAYEQGLKPLKEYTARFKMEEAERSAISNKSPFK